MFAHDPAPLSGPSDPSPAPPVAALRLGRVWVLALVAGFLAGAVSWWAGEATLTAFKPKLEVFEGFGGGTRLEPTPKGEIEADTRNATLAFGLLGASLGLALGVAGGLTRGSAGRGATAGLVGLVVGGALGVGASMALVPVFHRARTANPLSYDLTVPMLVHAGIWAAVGAAGGLAYGIGSGGDPRKRARAAVGGLVGGALAAAAYEMIGATVFPLADTPRPVSLTWGSRLLARLLVTTLAAAGVALVAVEPARTSP